jgi:hypothetical protein
MERIKGLLAVMAGAGIALAAAGVQAAESTVTVVKAPGKMDSLKVVRDKVTGKIRAATPEEIEELNAAPRSGNLPNAAQLNRPVTTRVPRPDGSATIRRGAEDLDEIVASKGADGKINLGHKHAAPSTQPKE